MDEKLIVAKNVKSLREASGFTQEQIASFVGVGRSAYSNYEIGIREVPFDVMEKLSDLYGCEMSAFYETGDNALQSVLATAFRVDNLSADDLRQIASFKRIVRNSLKMDILLAR